MRRKRPLIIIGLLTVFMFMALYNGLVVKKYIINTNKLDTDEFVRIVLISDLHNHVYGKNQTKLVSLIKKQNPDIIALAGDIADDQVPIAGTELFLDGIKGLAPIYYVSGNHEFWSNDINHIKNIIRKYDVTVLENSYEQISINNSSIIIGGVDDPDITKYEKPSLDWESELYKAFSELGNRPEFKILLSHRAELVDIYKNTYFDLVLSGHAHGGQVRIPILLNGLYAPNQGWFPKYAGGMYKHDSLTHIVSRGISYNPRLPRIFNPPEIVVIEVKGEETSQPYLSS